MIAVADTNKKVWELLSEIPDPEIPVISIVDLGIVRSVAIKENSVIVEITPTYSGCPAYEPIEKEIISKLHEQGYENVEIKKTLSPAWTTDWMNDDAKNKLIEYGIAPPSQTTGEHLKAIMEGKSKPVQCPYCNSAATKLTSAFGSTACKAFHYCNSCHQPFEEFKCH